MSKKIHTIQSSDKNEFDKEVNSLLGIGCELLENTYEVIKNDDGVIYSQVIEFDTINTYITFYNDGQLDLIGMLDKHGKRVGLYTSWYENGQKRFELTYKDGIHNGLLTWWYDNGQKESEGIYKDNKLEGLSTHWYENGQKSFEGTYKDGELISEKYWNEDGSVKE